MAAVINTEGMTREDEELRHIHAEMLKFQAETQRALMDSMRGEIALLTSKEEARKMRMETRWYPIAGVAALFTAATAFAKLLDYLF